MWVSPNIVPPDIRLECRLEMDEILERQLFAQWLPDQQRAVAPDLPVWQKLVWNPGPLSRVYGLQYRDLVLDYLMTFPQFSHEDTKHERVFRGLREREIAIQKREGSRRVLGIEVRSPHGGICPPEELPATVLDIILASWAERRGGIDWVMAREIMTNRLKSVLEVADTVRLAGPAAG